MLEHLDELKRKYTYDPNTGLLTWNITTRGRGGIKRPGEVAGSLYKSNGRIMAYVAGKAELVHRIAWVLMTGESPPKCIDHIDRDPTNNRWSNLRAVTMTQNQGNRSATKGRQLPTGVREAGNKYVARMTQAGKSIHLGTYRTVDLAEQAYRKAHDIYFKNQW